MGIFKTPKRMDPFTDGKHLEYEELLINRNENIVQVSGSSGSVVHHVKFTTDKGHELVCGTSTEGEPFVLNIAPSTSVFGLRGGIGRHLHSIGVISKPIRTAAQYQYGYNTSARMSAKKTAGPSHPDTVKQSHIKQLKQTAGQYRIEFIEVYYRDNSVLGLKVTYSETGKQIVTQGIGKEFNKETDKRSRLELEPDEHIQNISGYVGDYYDRLCFYTTKGQVYAYGDNRADNFNFEIPAGYVISGINFGIGGHLHFVTAHYGPEPKIFWFEQPPALNPDYNLFSKTSAKFGKKHPDTKENNDWGKIDKNDMKARLNHITVYHDSDNIYGFKLKWDVKGKTVEGNRFRGSSFKGVLFDGKETKIALSVGEYITNVWGKAGTRIDSLCFKTSEGDKYKFGGKGGDKFDCSFPPGHGLGALTCGTNGHLHYIKAWYGKINVASQGLPMVYYYSLDNRFPHEAFQGNVHPDTQEFSDKGLSINDDSFRIDKVKIYGTDKIVGFQFVYEVDGVYIQGEKHLASSLNLNKSDYHVRTLDLEVDEFITRIEGKSGTVIDHLKITTNKGRSIEAGGNTGDDFVLDIPEGMCVGLISGGKNGHIHNIKAYCGYIPNALSSRMVAQK